MLLIVSMILIISQNIIGTTYAYIFSKIGFDFDIYFGICLGSIPLVGGHGTSGSFGPLIEETCGVIGANPNTMLNMQAVTEKYGPSKLSYMAVPIVGGMFIDFINAIIITGFIEFIKNVFY